LQVGQQVREHVQPAQPFPAAGRRSDSFSRAELRDILLLIFNLAAKPASVTEFYWSLTPVPNGKLESAATACHRTSAVDFAQGGGISMAGKLI
jgi:hypothetical protein